MRNQPVIFAGKPYMSMKQCLQANRAFFGNDISADLFVKQVRRGRWQGYIDEITREQFTAMTGITFCSPNKNKKLRQRQGYQHSPELLRDNRLINSWPVPDWQGQEGEV